MLEGQARQVFKDAKPGSDPSVSSEPPVHVRHAGFLTKRLFQDEDLDVPVFERLSGRQGRLQKAKINGQPCFVGWVQFVSPNSFLGLLNPFSKFRDGFGNAYFVGGLTGALIAVHSAKLREPVPVTCVKRGDCEFEVVRWGSAEELSPFEEKPPLCECGEEVEFCVCEFKRHRQSRLAREEALA